MRLLLNSAFVLAGFGFVVAVALFIDVLSILVA